MATQIQAEVSSALQELKFEFVEGAQPGSPQELKVTQETVEYLKSLAERNQRVVVDSDGNIKVKAPK